MVKSGKYWRWPLKVDKVYYRPEHVLRKIVSPVPVNGSRLQFEFVDVGLGH